MPKSSITAGYADSSRSLQLDFIRGFAILMVLGRHPTWYPQFAGRLEGFGHAWSLLGLTAIDLFFVLSGFLIGGLLFKEWKKAGRIDTKRFLIRRMLKIWPAYFIYITFVLVAYIYEGTHGTPRQVVALMLPNFLHLQSYVLTPAVHTWSLSVEEHFYLALPFIVAFAARPQPDWRKALRVFVWIILGYVALLALTYFLLHWVTLGAAPLEMQPYLQPYLNPRFLLFLGGQLTILTAFLTFAPCLRPAEGNRFPAIPLIAFGMLALGLALRIVSQQMKAQFDLNWTFLFFSTHLRTDGIFFGVMLGYLNHLHPEVLKRVLARRGWLLGGGLLFVTLGIIVPEKGGEFFYMPGFTVLGLGYAALLLALVFTPLGEGLLGKFLASRLSRLIAWVGLHSYSIYLWHLNPLRYRFDKWFYEAMEPWLPVTARWGIVMAVYIVMSCLYGAALGKLIEQPLLHWRDRIFPARANALAELRPGTSDFRPQTSDLRP
jgi:peptidoglycan/LPS O-acetylase OafA/YrhL